MIGYAKKSFGQKNGLYSVCYVLAFLSALFGILLPQITTLIIDFVLNFSPESSQRLNALTSWLVGGQFGDPQTSSLLLSLSLVFVVVAVLMFGCNLSSNHLFNRYGEHFSGQCRRSGIKKITRLNNIGSESDVFLCLTTDISQYRDCFILHLPKIVIGSIIGFMALLLCFIINPIIGSVVLASFALIIVVIVAYIKKGERRLEDCRECEKDLEDIVLNATSNIKDIKVFGYADKVRKDFEQRNKQFTKKRKSVLRLNNITQSLSFFVRCLCYGFAIIYGAVLAFESQISIGYFVLILSYVALAEEKALSVLAGVLKYIECSINAKRYIKFMELPENGLTVDDNKVDKIRKIEFKDAKLSLGGKKVLKKVNFCVEEGQSLGILSYQGGGKSQILKVLERMQDLSEGECLINDLPIETYSLQSLRAQEGYVANKPHIFEGTIKSNIILYDNVSKAEYNEVSDKLFINEFAKELPHGHETKISSKGVLPSQDKMCICVARALSRQASLILLDSPFVQFTSSRTSKIIHNILSMQKKNIVIIASSRVVDIEHCSKIIVLQNGLVKEQGSKSELLALNGLFKEAYEKKEHYEA